MTMADEIKTEVAETAQVTEEKTVAAETKPAWPYASYPEGYNKLLNKIMPFWARPMKKMMGDLLIRVLVDG